MLAPFELRVIILTRCTHCHGEQVIDQPGDPDEDDTLIQCLRCENGTQAADVPMRPLLDAYARGATDEEIKQLAADLMTTQERANHSILRHAPNDLAPRLFPRK